ncbi:hypothetical protein BTVI_06885 [Pitangus sulphuratus]|nr:hypothetical protein BTVI_06885 [Pitangus sulphuratus]
MSKVLHLGQGNPWYQSRMGGEQNKSSPAKKDLGMPALSMCACSPETNHVLGCIKRGVASRVKEVILPLCLALVRLNLEYCVQFWGPKNRKDIDLLERVQRRSPR